MMCIIKRSRIGILACFLGLFSIISQISAGNPPCTWQSQDVGNVGTSGSVDYVNDIFTIRGAGNGLPGSSSDACRYTFQTFSGDGTLQAKISDVINISSNTSAGIMLREDLSQGSRMIAILAKADGTIEFQKRESRDAVVTERSNVGSSASPAWLKVSRSGSAITAYYSSDGRNWYAKGSSTISLSANYLLGFSVTSGLPSTATTATIDNHFSTRSPITISGRVVSLDNQLMSGVTITLAGSCESTTASGPNGTYSFKNLPPGSYSIRAYTPNVSFTPDVYNMNNITSSQARDFTANVRVGINTDLAIQFISRAPRCNRYDVLYSPQNYNPQLRPGTENQKRWPFVGEEVLYTVRIVNQGGSPVNGLKVRWLLDGGVRRQESVTSANIGPGQKADLHFIDFWQDGEHTLRCDILDYQTGNPLSDLHNNNNFLERKTNSLSYTAYVWQSVEDYMRDHVNITGTYSMSDWINFQVAQFNRLLRTSTSPLSPNGVNMQIALNEIRYVPSNTVSITEACPDDACLQFGNADPAIWQQWIENVRTRCDEQTLHDMAHGLGLFDLAKLSVKKENVWITNGQPAEVETYSNSSVGNNIKNLFDMEYYPIRTYEARPVYFAVKFLNSRAITRMKIKFTSNQSNVYELYCADNLDDIINKTPAAIKVAGPTVCTGIGWTDAVFTAPPNKPYWGLWVERQDGDRFVHVEEWEFYLGPRLLIMPLIYSNLVAGTNEMQVIGSDNEVFTSSIQNDLMTPLLSPRLDQFHTWSLNSGSTWNGRNIPARRGYTGTYLFNIPSENTLVITRNNAPVAGASVEIFQHQDGRVPDTAKYNGFTDNNGYFRIPHLTTAEYARLYNQTSITTANPFSTTISQYPSVVGTNGTLIIRIKQNGQTWYKFIDIPQFTLEYARGHQNEGFYPLNLN